MTATLDDKTLTIVTDNAPFVEEALRLGVVREGNRFRDHFEEVLSYKESEDELESFAAVFRERLHPDDFWTLGTLWGFSEIIAV